MIHGNKKSKKEYLDWINSFDPKWKTQHRLEFVKTQIIYWQDKTDKFQNYLEKLQEKLEVSELWFMEVVKEIFGYEKHIKSLNRFLNEYNALISNKKKITQIDIEKAKEYPINEMIEFKNGFAKCINHEEKHGSLKYYPETNTAYCFGACKQSFDAIDCAKILYGLNFINAVKKLAGKT